MSFKEGRRNRSWTSRLLAALFRPFMPEEAPPELPHLLFQDHNNFSGGHLVTNWYRWMVDDHTGPDNHYLMCPLDHIDYYKCVDGAKHEFLLFYFRHWTGSSAEAAVCAERTVERGHGSRQSSDIISPSSKETAATDRAFLLGSPDSAIQHLRDKAGRCKKLCTLTFLPPSAPSALHVAAILCLVHRQAPAYNLYDSQCYWYADSVWMSLKRIFPQNEESCKDHNARNHYYSVGGLGQSSATVEAVCADYPEEWRKTVDKLTQVKQALDERVQRKAERVADERVRQTQQAADERIRQLQRAADEQAQRAAEEKAQIRQAADEQLRKVQRAADEQLRKAQRAAEEQTRAADEQQRKAQRAEEHARAVDEQLRKAHAEIEQLRAMSATSEGRTTAI